MKLGIQSTLALFFLAIMVVSLPVFLLLSLRISTQMIDQQVRHQLESEVVESVDLIELVLRPIDNVLNRLSENYSLLSYLRTRSQLQNPDLDQASVSKLREEEEIYRWGSIDEFQRLLRLNSEFERVAFVDRNGEVILQEGRLDDPLAAEDVATVFPLAMAAERGTPVVEDRVLKDGILRYAISVIRDENVGVRDDFMQPALALLGQPIRAKEGVLILDFRFETLKEKLLNAHVTGVRGGAFFLVDADWHLLAAPDRYESLLNDWLTHGRQKSRSIFLEGEYEWQGRSYLTALWPYSERRWHVGVLAPKSEFTLFLEQASWKLIFASIVLFTIALLVAQVLIRQISSPLEKFVILARQIAQGNFNVRVHSRGSREVSNLASAFNHMAGQLETYVEEVRKKEQLEGELKTAHKIQAGLLPERVPDIQGVAINARTIPAREVGGDYYDFLANGPDRFGLVVADVTGRGVPAALVMSMIRSLLRGQAQEGTPGEVLSRINELIHRDVSASRHSVAMFFGVFDPQSRILKFANAGQMFPLLYRGHDRSWQYLELSGIPLGIRPDFTYQVLETQLEPGDRLILYTDGIVESENSSGELFGFDRFESLLEETTEMTPEATIEYILDRLREFTGNLEPDDDLTLAVLKVVDPNTSS